MFCCWRISPVNHKLFLSFERVGDFMVLLFWLKLSFHALNSWRFFVILPTQKTTNFYLRCSWRWGDWWGRGDAGFWIRENFVWNSYNLPPKKTLIFSKNWLGRGSLMITTVDTKLGDMRILLASWNWKMTILASFPKHSYTCWIFRVIGILGQHGPLDKMVKPWIALAFTKSVFFFWKLLIAPAPSGKSIDMIDIGGTDVSTVFFFKHHLNLDI